MPGFGYSNRLKALLLCGAVVIHVEPKNSAQEFFRPLLVPGKHLIVVPSVKDILPTVARLRANTTLALRIGRAGRRLALSQLSMSRALGYVRALLTSFSSVQRERVVLEPGYTRLVTSADAGRLVRSCTCPRGLHVCPATEDAATTAQGASGHGDGASAGGRGGHGGRRGGRRLTETARLRTAGPSQGRALGQARDARYGDRARDQRRQKEELLSASTGSSHCCVGSDCPNDVCPMAFADV